MPIKMATAILWVGEYVEVNIQGIEAICYIMLNTISFHLGGEKCSIFLLLTVCLHAYLYPGRVILTLQIYILHQLYSRNRVDWL